MVKPLTMSGHYDVKVSVLMMGIKSEKKALSFIEDSAIPIPVLPEVHRPGVKDL
jgi:hypothetical protein